jgi:hypothetical protein
MNITWEDDFGRGGDGPELDQCLGPQRIVRIEAALAQVPSSVDELTLAMAGFGYLRSSRRGNGWHVVTDPMADRRGSPSPSYPTFRA